MEFNSLRGVVEGFYGPPYPPAVRKRLISEMSGSPGPAWLHAPKDDPWHRIRWREERPPAARRELAGCISHARSEGVAWIGGVSPWSFVPGDGGALLARCREASADGASAVAVLFDDVPDGPDPELAAAQLTLCGVLEGEGLPVLVCPSVYCEAQARRPGGREYLCAFREMLPESWGVLWTGSDVIPRVLSAPEQPPGRGGRTVLWDNLLADDWSLRRLFMGSPAARPVQGLGYLLNPSPRLVPALSAVCALFGRDRPAELAALGDGLDWLASFHDTPWSAGPAAESLMRELDGARRSGGGFPAAGAEALRALEALREAAASDPGAMEILPWVADLVRLLSIWSRALAADGEAGLAGLMLERLPYEHPLAAMTAAAAAGGPGS